MINVSCALLCKRIICMYVARISQSLVRSVTQKREPSICKARSINSAFKATPVIMLSSKDGLFDKAKGRIVGSDEYLTKPFSKDELLGAIRQHV